MYIERRLPFLDVAVTRRDSGRLMTGVHRNSDRVLEFDSHHPAGSKRAVVIALFDRVESHCNKDDVLGRRKEIAHLFEVLQQNGYPAVFWKER